MNNKDFEKFVKQNADQYRMYPSEKVWTGIYSTLHTRRTWYGLGFVLLLLTAFTITRVMLSSPASKQLVESSTKNQDNAIDEKKSALPISHSDIQPNNLPSSFIALVKQTEPSVFSVSKKSTNKNIKQQFISAADFDKSVISNNSHTDSYNDVTPSNTPLSVNINDPATDNEYDLSRLTKPIFSGSIIKKTAHNNVYPMSIESIVNSYKASVKNRKVNWQLFFTPTISYRRLTENKSFLRSISFASGVASYASIYNVNSVVTHKPDMGLELGIVGGYPLTKNINVRVGLQFNINRYGIKAFSYPGEVATIALNSGNDSVAKWTNYRNFGGYNSNWLQNFYFSVSVPLGVELNLSGNNKTQFGIAGAIQPTYVIGDKAYLISTDYKNYIQVPWLIRRWNVNTSFETFVGYSTGKIKWKVGPQVRYQLLSSFQNKYPVKENLFDFGLKVGVMLNK